MSRRNKITAIVAIGILFAAGAHFYYFFISKQKIANLNALLRLESLPNDEKIQRLNDIGIWLIHIAVGRAATMLGAEFYGSGFILDSVLVAPSRLLA